jgi:hypothetical protein
MSLLNFIQGIFFESTWSRDWLGVLQSGTSAYFFVWFGGSIAPKFKANVCVILGTLLSGATVALFTYTIIIAHYPWLKIVWTVADAAATVIACCMGYFPIKENSASETQ